MSAIPFPRIPAVADAMILSAATATAYNRGLRHLLGEGHAPFSAYDVCETKTVVSDSVWGTIWTGSIYLRAKTNTTFYWGMRIRTHGEGGTWYARLQIDDDTPDNWADLFSTSGTDDDYAWKSSSQVLSGFTITANTMYKVRLQLKNADVRVYYFAEGLAIQGWQALDTHSGDDESHVDDFNHIRTDLNALNAILSPVNTLARNKFGDESEIYTTGNYYEVLQTAYCYRPENLRCDLELHQHNPGAGRTYQWKIEFIDHSGNSATLYESAAVQSPSTWFWLTKIMDLTTAPESTTLAAAGITLTLGNYYKVIVSAKRAAGSEKLYARNGFVLRLSDQTPDGSWVDPTDWAHGDNDVGPANMNKYKTDLTLLYSGAELLHSGTFVHAYTSGTKRFFSGVHRKRWLWFYPVTDETTALHFGTDYKESLELDSGDGGWQQKDMTATAVPWGSYYHVSGCQCAMEID